MTSNAPSENSVTVWFSQLCAGDPAAAEKLWNRFFDRLVIVAGQQMASANRRVVSEEDIAVGVMAALCRCARRGQLPAISNRDDLWQQLLCWTKHDVIDHLRATAALKRGSNRVRGDSVFSSGSDPDGDVRGFDGIADQAATPEMLADMDEQLRVLLDRLPEAKLRQLAILKMEGFTNAEIATKQGVSPSTIDRKLKLIRSIWSEVQ